MKPIQHILGIGAAALALIGPSSAMAQADTFPSKPLRCIVPFPAGGVVDSIARIVCDKLQTKYGQPAIVENKAGASGSIGMEYAARAQPDGYTLLFVATGLAVLPSVVKDLKWDPVRDFRAIQGFGVIPGVFVVPSSVPVKSMAELVTLAGKSANPLSYGSAGFGTTQHLSGELLSQRAGVELIHVPYKGQPNAVIDLVEGRITTMALSVSLAVPLIKQGKLRGLAVTTASRSKALSDLPTVAEAANLPGYEVTTWVGMVAPAKVPDEIRLNLATAVAEILDMPDVKTKLESMGLDLDPQSPAQFDAYVANETAKWSKVLKQAGIEPR